MLFDTISHQPRRRILRITVVGVSILLSIIIVNSFFQPSNSTADSLTQDNSGISTSDLSKTAASLLPVIEKKPIFDITDIPYASKRVNDSSLAVGTETIKTAGKMGRRVAMYDGLFVDGKEVSRTLVSDLETFQPVNEVVAVGTRTENACAYQITINRDGENICIKRDKKFWRDWFSEDA